MFAQHTNFLSLSRSVENVMNVQWRNVRTKENLKKVFPQREREKPPDEEENSER